MKRNRNFSHEAHTVPHYREMVKKGIFVVLLNCILIAAYPQATTNLQTQLPNIFPVNPKAAEFLKYTEVPVGKYTGVPNVDIPIYNIATNGLNIPVTLSYHSNGNKVTEEAGWTGLGWSLSGGGSITQVVNGFDDFGWYRNRNNELQAMVNACNVPPSAFFNAAAVDFKIENIENFIVFNNVPPQYVLPCDNRLTEGLLDIKPDVFKFNMLGYSGEFVLDWVHENFKCISDRNIKIEAPNYSNGSGGEVPPNNFKIIMPDGNQFLFTLKEESITSGVARYSAETVPYMDHLIGSKSSRSYQLTSIYTKGGDLVSFNYIQTAVLENLPAVSLSFTFQEGAQGVTPIPFTNNPISTTVNYSRQSLSYLSAIEFPTGKLLFNSSDDRIDYVGMRKLNSIELKDVNNTVVKSFSFTYDYFIGHSLGNNTDAFLDASSPVYHTGKIASELTHRLKLLSVKESDKPAYVFEYDPGLLPKKTSMATDNWGLYNEKINNSSLMPNISMMGLRDVSLIGLSNNKNSSLPGSKAAVLNKITYPTGGTSSFEYELNTMDNFRVPDDQHSTVTSVSLNDRNNPGDNPAQIFSADIASIMYAGTFNISTVGPMSSGTNGMSAYIRLTVLQKTAQNITLTNTPATFWPMYYTTPMGQLSGQVNGVLQDSRILQFEFNSSTQQYETFKLAQDQVIMIDPDKIYIVQAYLDNSFGPQTNGSQGANASVDITFLKNMNHAVSYGAGLRIKSIRTTDPLSPPLIKSYEYNGGKLMSPLLYLTNHTVDYAVAGTPTVVPIWVTDIGSASFLPPSTNASGKYVGYDWVSEMSSSVNPANQSLLQLNGKIEDFYTNNPDKGALNSILSLDPGQFDGTQMYLPMVDGRAYLNYIAPLQKFKLENGLSITNSVFDANQVLLERTVNNWNYVTEADPVYSRVSTLGSRSSIIPNTANTIRYIYNIGFYPLVSTKTLLQATEKKVFSGPNTIVTTQEYFYDSHNQLSYSTTTDSKGNTVKSTNKYPYDFAQYATMAFSNYVPVIEKTEELITTAGTKPISKIRNDYTGTTSASGTLVWDLSSVATSKANNSLETEITYDLYGSYNTPEQYKLLQYHDRKGIVTSIIWGYGGQYPVAKIVGKSYADAVSQSGLSLTLINNGSITDVAMRTELNKLRALAGCFITSFTYKMLVGVTSETDANNKTTFYEYDSFGRLTLVRDKDNNIVKKICYNYAGQAENCAPPCTNFNPVWKSTNTALRCQQGSCGNTGYQEQEQKDINPCSPTYNQTQWINAGYNPSACVIPSTSPNWQNTTTPLRCQQGPCGNTGYQEQEQIDINTCSATYNQTRWISVGFNPAVCPVAVCNGNISLTSNNGTTRTTYVASYYNTGTGITYSFNIPLGNLQTFGSVPAGNYNLSIYSTVTVSSLTSFKSGCKSQTITGTSAIFYNISVSAISCNTISIISSTDL